MATNLLKAGFQVVAHNRTRDKELPLVELGAERAGSPREAADGCRIVITIVSDTPDVEEVLFGPQGVVEAAADGTIVIDMSTIDPKATESFAERLESSGLHMLDAPVSGGTEGAESGKLTIMVGGREEVLERARPVLEAMGSKITHIGPSGTGQMTKAINQVVIAGTLLAVAEGVTLGLAAGLDMEKVLSAMGPGAAGSWALTNRGPRMVEDHYPLGFKISLHRKDLQIALGVAKASGLNLKGASLVAEIEQKLIAAGFGDEDVSAIARGVKPGPS